MSISVTSVCDLETIDVPIMFNVIRHTVVLARMLPTLDLMCFPDDPITFCL
jgi:hypothetical protein